MVSIRRRRPWELPGRRPADRRVRAALAGLVLGVAPLAVMPVVAASAPVAPLVAGRGEELAAAPSSSTTTAPVTAATPTIVEQDDGDGGTTAPWVIASGIAAVLFIGIGGTIAARRTR